jgi:cytochrome P450 monooxygenase
MSASEELTTLGNDDPAVPGSGPWLHGERPVILVNTPAGDKGWLVTRYSEIRELLRDPRLGRSHPDPANKPRYIDSPLLDMLVTTTDPDVDRRNHAKARAFLTPLFSARRMAAWRPRIADCVRDAVDTVLAQGPPVQVHSQFSQPLTSQVLGQLVGIPEGTGQPSVPVILHRLSAADAQEAESSRDAVLGYLCQLAASKRAEPGDDVLSSIIRAGGSDEDSALLALSLLLAGFDSSSTNTSLGIARIASDPVLRDRLAADPALMEPAVEEFLRTARSEGLIFPHYAREDIEIADVTIRAGDLVLVDYALGNFDERAFPAPDEMDITRLPNPHLGFGHGTWHCIGAPLARVQLATAFTALLSALPTLRLAKPVEETAGPEARQLADGLAELLVTW